NSFKIYKRDRYNHSSPNSAHPEAAVAGALGIRLGGANYYFGKLVEKPTIGDAKKKIEISDVYKTNNILGMVSFLGMVVALIIRCILEVII
ncbi:MAG: cobalamin biosynthesis protein, partial [Clostridium perfringens]|nr:cobalamin biosynthesis protein [Clostridium perfringens]